MDDRLVAQIDPEPKSDTARALFSTFLDHRNLVLLGNPGAGKTHLFRHFGSNGEAIYLTARDFLNLPIESLTTSSTLFIDALDEKRSGRGDSNTIDAIVAKLCLVKPTHVRISCRAADWLGQTDLAAFRAYFDRSGGCIVLALSALTEEERIAVLTDRGIESPEMFLREAERRGLEDLLANPQNLVMLSDVVGSGDWPNSKQELFEASINLLLSEHNIVHSDSERGRFAPKELLYAAGGLCAVRLISDCAGISLSNSSTSEDYPSFRDLGVDTFDKVQAALSRRVFIAKASASTADYAHRTIAEYLAARWIAKQVRAGLPIERVSALIGVEGRPASELRGLHAWLPVLLPELATTLIDADPFGIVTYGDAASLSPGMRRHLLSTLGELAQTDPWFREGNWSAEVVAALSGPDMEQSFREILVNHEGPFVIRSIVLDALSAGTSIPGLMPELVAISIDGRRPYAERHAAVQSLLRINHRGVDEVIALYQQLGATADDIRLRAEILQEKFVTKLGAPAFAETLNTAISLEDDDLVTGAFWGLGDAVSTVDIEQVLDQIDIPVGLGSATRRERRNSMEVLHVLDRLLVRVITEIPGIDAARLLRWLHQRRKLTTPYSGSGDEGLQQALASNQELILRLANVGIDCLEHGEHRWSSLHRFEEATLFSIDGAVVAEKAIAAIEATNDDERRRFLYELAFNRAYQARTSSLPLFERLCAIADEYEALKDVRDACCVCEIPDWKRQDLERSSHREKKLEERQQTSRSRFDKDRQKIASGRHFGWLEWAGNMYYARFDDVDRHATAQQRLTTELGEERTLLILQAFSAFLKTQKITSLTDVIKMHEDRKYYPWWYAVLAALEEHIHSVEDLNQLSPDYLQAAVAIDVYFPTYVHRLNNIVRIEPTWKDILLETRPRLVADVYQRLARADLAKPRNYVHGLNELLRKPSLAQFRADAAEALLREFPFSSAQSIRSILPVLLEDDGKPKVIDLVEMAVAAAEGKEISDAYLLWLAVGYIVLPDSYRLKIDSLNAEHSKSLVWNLRDLSGYSKLTSAAGALSTDQLEYIIRLVAKHYVRAQHPSSGWSGDQNPWDASDYVRKMIGQMSSQGSTEAAAALARLLISVDLATYHDDIKHASAQQRIRRIDSQFEQPTWRQAIKSLLGGPPANISDLHALLRSHLVSLKTHISAANTDVYKRFWNENGRGQPTEPKSEDSARDVLVGELRRVLLPYSIIIEPEGHMANDKRADAVAMLPHMKAVVELKRDYHAEVWDAALNQLDRFYTRDPEANGFGIYGVFWYGRKRAKPIPRPPSPLRVPDSAAEMELQLNSLIPLDKQAKIKAIVWDVSGEID